MRIYDLLKKKRDGEELSKEEIVFFVHGFTKGEITDYHASAMLMAMFINELSQRETIDLTRAILTSGNQIDLSAIKGVKVDKHSTGGVGDTTTLIVAPLVAACGVPVAKMSGKGLGHTGGTLDKLESIKDFKIDITMEDFKEQVNKHKIAVISQTQDVAPGDKKIYLLRDLTATVDSMPLIASSIMSKKLASGTDAILLDVKVGSGAFMKTIEDARTLATEMVNIGKGMKKDTIAIITDMNQPLGNAIGNALEVKEAIEVLKNKGPKDMTQLCIELASKMVVLGKKADNYEQARNMIIEKIENGQGLDKFRELVEIQGGNGDIVQDISLLPSANYRYMISAPSDGYIEKLNSEEVGLVAMMLGAGRETKDSVLDYSAGILLKKKVGDLVKKGEQIAELHYNNSMNLEAAIDRFNKAVSISSNRPEEAQLIKEIIQ